MTTVTALLPTPTCPLCGSDDPKKVKKRPDGAFYCYRCKRSIGAVERPQKRTDPITDAFVEAAHRTLCADAKALAWLTDHRCIPLPVIKSQRLGLDGNKILFPIPGDGEWVNIRCANYVTGEKRPYQTGRGVQLYPGTLAPTKELLICEGELDRLVALGLGFEACTGIGGAGVFHSTWAAEIAQKAEHVVIVYDADHAGRSGARLVATRLMEQGVLATRIKSVHLPVPFKPKHGEDLTDWVRRGATAKDLRTLIGDTPTWEYVERAPGEVPADATERSLAEASHKDHSREWSTFEASIIALLADAYQLPTKISVDCAEDQSKYCPHCTLPAEKSRCAPGEAPIISLDTTSDAYVDHIGAAKKNLRQQILESIGIPGKCPSAQVDELETIQVQEGRIGEPLNIDVETRASDRSAIFIDLEGVVEPNKEYRMLGKFLPHPKDQVMTAVIHRAVGVDQLVEHFEEDPKLLAPMRKGRPRTLEKRVQRILDDATAITRIRGRDDMHLMILLSRMSTLYLESPESETRERGWADVAIIGDTSEGKSEAMEKLSAWTGLGNVVALKKATTRAGLFGGVVQTQKKLYIAWGVYPRHDRRWLAPDEFHSAPADLLAAMTDARSSGVAQVYMAGVAATTSCRVRLCWGANPRSEMPVAAHAYGYDTIAQAFRRPEDIRRLDAAMVVAKGEVDEATRSADPGEVKIWTRERALHLEYRAWAQRGVPVGHLLEAAKSARRDFITDYGETISPLIEPNSLALKIIRLAVALANLLAEEPKVAHIEYVAAWLDRIYSSEVMGLRTLARVEAVRAKLADERQVRAALGMTGDLPRTAEAILLQGEWALSDLRALANDHGVGQHLAALLVRNRALTRTGAIYRKTPAFVKLLKEIVNG